MHHPTNVHEANKHLVEAIRDVDRLLIHKENQNNKNGPDGNIRHLKHPGSLALRYFTNMYKTTLNTNTLLHLGKSVTTISISKPNKDHSIGTNYQSISLLPPIAKTQEKTLLT